MRFPRIAAVALLLAPSLAAAQITVHNSNFNSGGVPGGYSTNVGSLAIVAPSGTCISGTYCTNYLGDNGGNGGLNNQTVNLFLNGLSPHTTTTVSFSLFMLDSWDGNGYYFCCGPDVMQFRADGNTLLNTTFSNTGAINNVQCYPVVLCPGYNIDNTAQTGAAEANTLGTAFYGNSVYNLSYTFAHTGSSLSLDWEALGLQGQGDESWGIDNVNVQINEMAAPEPASVVLMATGLLGLGVAVRRRRTVPVA